VPKGGVESIARRGQNAQKTLEALRAVSDFDGALSALERALELAELHAVPEDAAAFVIFVCGPLFDAISERLGEAAARSVDDRLMDDAEPSAPRAPSPPIEAPRPEGPVIIVASADDARRAAIARGAESFAHVEPAPSLATLVAAVEASLDRSLVLIVDGPLPGADGSLLLTLARLLPPSARIVFCGDPPSGLYTTSLVWTTLSESAPVDEVVAKARTDMGSPPRALGERALVVVVSPEEVARSLLVRRLEHEGFLVIGCDEPLAALEACIDHDPDLLIAELDMPDLDGVALARLVRGRLGEGGPAVLLRGSGVLSADDARYATVVDADARFADLLAQARRLAPGRRR
jgi:CheY-like chemotaxis protein